MHVIRTERARHTAQVVPKQHLAPRAAAFCRLGSPLNTRFAPVLLVFVGILPAVVLSGPLPDFSADQNVSIAPLEASGPEVFTDKDSNGVEDILDQWLDGSRSWEDLRGMASSPPSGLEKGLTEPNNGLPAGVALAGGPWAAGGLRVIRLGGSPGDLDRALEKAGGAGRCELIHVLERFGGVAVLGVDQVGLAAFLKDDPGGRIVLDRDGVPALAFSRSLMGAAQAADGHWWLGEDWSSSVAILDSGCDTAHDDLGDYFDDDLDGPAPFVGDASDWWPASAGWPTSQRYKVVGWEDVTDDFPEAVGPWDYHYHGTALASVVAGSGLVEPAYHGLSPNTHLTVVKFYDFDDTWHAWTGDFLAACDWTLANRELYRIRTVLIAVNWEVDAGISEAMSAMLDEGILPVAAMGNYGPDTGSGGFPASLSSVLTVGAVNGSGAVAAYSGRGVWGMDKPDLLAPGGGLLRDAGRIMVCDNEPNDSYSERQGTSLAAAHAAGALALLDEALRKSGLEMPADRTAALTRKAILKATCARVDFAENDTGTDDVSLAEYSHSDPVRGWGLLRIDAAVEGALMPLLPGRLQQDYIASDWWRPVVARRLVLQKGVEYRIEVRPAGNLDIALEIVDPRWLDRYVWQSDVIRVNSSGTGISEFIHFSSDSDQFLILAVKRVSGSGDVWMTISEVNPVSESGKQVILPGILTGSPNWGTLTGQELPSMVIPSLVAVDPEARALNVLDPDGDSLPSWPVFLFPHPSSQGGLTQPLVWDFDGIIGDEIVIASNYGSLYFFQGDALYQEVELEFNLALTAPVGFVNALGQPLVATVDRNGRVFTYSLGPVLEWTRDLSYDHPFPPAVGQLTGSAVEEMVVSFANGMVAALDAQGNPLAGWPVNLGTELASPPVLCDLDADGFHEVIQPVFNQETGTLGMRVIRGDGLPGPGDGVAISPSGGGGWLALSAPVVAGNHGTGDLRVVMAGVAGNGQAGEQVAWTMDLALLYSDGSGHSSNLPAFSIRGISEAGVLKLDKSLLAPPICWNNLDGSGSDPQTLVHLRWQEVLSGLTSVPGGMTAWVGEPDDGRPLTGRQDVLPGGPALGQASILGGMLVPLDGGFHQRVEVVDKTTTFQTVANGLGLQPIWASSRGDSRNSGSYPLKSDATAVATPAVSGHRVWVSPNPGSSRLFFRWEGPIKQDGITWEVFDLRGRRVRSLKSSVESGSVLWDATDQAGRPVAAGSYLVRARSGNTQAVSRVILQR